jgi:hypothetical protein
MAPPARTGSRRSGRRAAAARSLAIAPAVLAVLGLAACGNRGGDDDSPASGDGPVEGGVGDTGGTDGEGEVADDVWPQAPGVTLEAQVSPGDRSVTIAFVVTNTGDAAVAVPDPAATPDRESVLGDGTVRVSFLGTEGRDDAGSGGEPVPPGEGILLASGAGHSGTTSALTRGGDLPERVEVCVEVVTDFSADDDGDGIVTFPYRPAPEPPTVACSGPVDVG